MHWLLTPTDSVNKPPQTIDTARSHELVYTWIGLFRYMTMSSSMIEYACMQTAYEELMKFKTKKQFSWEKQTQ